MDVELLVLAVDKPFQSAKTGRTYYSATVRIGSGIGQVSSDEDLTEYIDEKVLATLDFELGFNSKKLMPRISKVSTL